MPNHHNHPFYVTAYVHDVELKCGLINPGYFLDIMPLLTLEATGFLIANLLTTPAKYWFSDAARPLLLAYIKLHLTIGPIGAVTCFHIIYLKSFTAREVLKHKVLSPHNINAHRHLEI